MNNEQQAPQYAAEEEIDLREYLEVLLDARWLIAGIALLTTLCAIAFALISTPIYQADSLLQVEEKQSSIGGMDELGSLLSGDTPTDAELEIIKSRMVIGNAVERLKLNIIAKPSLFPVIGGFFYRRHSGDTLAEPLFGLTEYCWGGETINISTLEVPSIYKGKVLTLRVTDDNSTAYAVYDDEEKLLFSGKLGLLVLQNGFTIRVDNLHALQGAAFNLMSNTIPTATKGLQANISVSEQGKSTGILRLTIQDSSAMMAMSKLDTIAAAYLEQNLLRKSEEAQSSLSFLQEQLPKIKIEMEAAEKKLNAYRLNQGSVNLDQETQSLLQLVVDIEKQLSSLEVQRAALSEKFTNKHPVMEALLAKRNRLLRERKTVNKRVQDLPDTEQELLSLSRDVQVSAELYTFMLNKLQELQIVKAGTIGNVRVIDKAYSDGKPIKPKKSLIVLLGLFAGLFIGILLAFIRHSMHNGIEDVAAIEALGLSVFASIPYAYEQQLLSEHMNHYELYSEDYAQNFLLAESDSEHIAIEALRNLRTSLAFMLLDEGNIVMITGPSPQVGKSFVAVNFAALLANAGQSIVLVDADMRRGHINKYLAQERKPGLSNYLSGQANGEDILQTTSVDNLSFIARGKAPPNPAELLMHPRFEQLLNKLSKDFDVVVIDTPPVLAVTDALIIGKYAAASFLLLRFGRHDEREVQQVMQQMKKSSVKISGAILNGVEMRRSYNYGKYNSKYNNKYKYHYHYQYEYKSLKEKE
ncbi:MAG: polysaccharide biosynthesis tyrosine autokinase [Mariprofundales bacterium]